MSSPEIPEIPEIHDIRDIRLHSPLILLAGGKSSRMGRPKGLIPFGGTTWLEHQLASFRACGTDAVVVLGYGHENYGDPHLVDVRVVINASPERGQFSSLQAGISGLAELLDARPGAFVLPIDAPAADSAVWSGLEFQGEREELDACIPRYQGRSGHPVWLSSRFLRLLEDIPSDRPQARLDRQIEALAPERRGYLMVTDPRVCMNLNTPEQFSAFASSSSGGEREWLRGE